MKAFQNERREAPLFFWRDATRHEIDILVDFGDRLLPIEVKSGLTLGADAGDGLRWWLELPGNDNADGTLVYGGDESYLRKNLAVRPWFLT